MKLSSVNNSITPNRQQSTGGSKNPSFKGVAGGLVNFWQFVDNGGRALQFTVEDMCGTNIPRTVKGAMAGKKYTGKINVPALLQEAVREFLTGPTMCVTPVAILTLAMKLSGKTANTHVENIKNLSYLLNKSTLKNTENIKDGFYSTVVEDLIENSTGKVAKEENVETLSKAIKNYAECNDKKQAKKLLSNLQTTFEKIVKSEKESYKGADFLSAQYSISKQAKGSTKFKNYVGYINSYIEDFTKKYGDSVKSITEDNVKAFKNSWIGKRLFTMAGMFFITGILMFKIPRLYTKVSGKINPNASAIYNEAKKGTPAEAKKDEATGEAK